MSHLNNEITTQITAAVADVDAKAVPSVASTKDAGRVKIGGGAIRFKAAPANSKDAGRVKVGGGAIQF